MRVLRLKVTVVCLVFLLLLDLAQISDAHRRRGRKKRNRMERAHAKAMAKAAKAAKSVGGENGTGGGSTKAPKTKRQATSSASAQPPPYYPGYKSSSALCYEAGEGFHPNPTDCTRFIRCIRQGSRRRGGHRIMTRYDFDCAPGTVYDPDIEVCNFPGEGGTPEGCDAGEPAPWPPEPEFDDPTPRPRRRSTTTTELPPPEPLISPPPATTTAMPPQCNCNVAGTVKATSECDTATGACACKRHVDGGECDRCKFAYFNFEAENEFGCSPCFCFGHTKNCTSAPGWNQVPVRSQFAKGYGQWTAEDGATGAAVDIAWVKSSQEISVTGTTDGQTIYYLTPKSYLGEQRRSFNRNLNFTLWVNPPADPASAPGKQPFIILEGSGLRVTLSITNQKGFAAPFPAPAAQNYSVVVHPDYGWQPRLTEPQFLKLLSNVTAIKIKGTYSAKGTSTIDNVFLETARRLPNGPPAGWVEQCTCPEGYTGMSCEACAAGFMRKTCGGDVLDECVACDCGKLKACAAGDETNQALESCGCRLDEPEIARTAPAEVPPETTTTTTTTPAPTTTTLAPTTTTTTTEPPPCACNITGALAESKCHPGTSNCVCKDNVMGPACDSCSDGHFNLQKSDPAGCLPCFCFLHTTKCFSAPGYNFLPVRSVFARGYGKWTAQDSKGKPIQIGWTRASQDAKATATTPDQQLYFIAPDSYLGEQRRSFNKFLNFTLYIDNQPGFLQLGDEDIILEGSGLRVALIAFNDGTSPGNVPRNYSFRLHPDAGWEPKLTEGEFRKLLSKLTVLKIRATYMEQGTGFLDNVFLETARKLPGGEPVGWVEECECPPGYSGLGCEDCAPGFMRATCGGDSFEKCVPCDCSVKCPDVGEVHNKCTC